VIIMIDEIFEMVMKEARSRKGDDLKLNAYYVINDLYNRVFHTVDSGPGGFLNFPSKDDEAA